ncbi:hypothetical protein ACG83_10235 [Frankia sp. R43]|uniref:hypothetical protein n=1 Tax=Frankia sp. R43 TaxID=269536 RepID=UPI0006C9F051|nr:hypothetical protein [Frankia sp. R43]KPM55659.1 hypothetical protein ACG83_10235 [Frankia sp. R43]
MTVRRPPRPILDHRRLLVDGTAYLQAATDAIAKVDPNKLDQAGLLAYAQACATVALAGRVDDLPEQIRHELR